MAYSGDGVNDGLTASNPSVPSVGTMCILYQQNTTPADLDVICAFSDSQFSGEQIRLSKDHRFGFDYSATHDGVSATDSSTASDDFPVWHRIISTWDTTNIDLYFDGVNSSNTHTGAISNINRFTIGFYEANTGGADFDNGSWAECACWNRILSAEELQSLEDTLLAPSAFPRGLIHYWPLIRGFQDVVGGMDLAEFAGSGVTLVEHPPVTYPTRRTIVVPAGAPPADVGHDWLPAHVRRMSSLSAARLREPLPRRQVRPPVHGVAAPDADVSSGWLSAHVQRMAGLRLRIERPARPRRVSRYVPLTGPALPADARVPGVLEALVRRLTGDRDRLARPARPRWFRRHVPLTGITAPTTPSHEYLGVITRRQIMRRTLMLRPPQPRRFHRPYTVPTGIKPPGFGLDFLAARILRPQQQRLLRM